MLREIEQRKMPPRAGVKLLPVQDEQTIGGGGIGVGAEACDIGKALLLVDDQVVHDIEVFRLCLGCEVRRRVAIQTAVIHVHVQVAAPPVAAAAQWSQTFQGDDERTRPLGGARIDLDASDLI